MDSVRLSKSNQQGNQRGNQNDESVSDRFIFLRKIPKRKNLNPPTLSFSCQFFKNIFLGNFVQIFVRFDFRLHLILNPPGYDFQLKFLKIFSGEISLRFCHDFTDRSYSVRNTSNLSIRRGCIRYNPYMPQLTRSRGHIDNISTLDFALYAYRLQNALKTILRGQNTVVKVQAEKAGDCPAYTTSLI